MRIKQQQRKRRQIHLRSINERTKINLENKKKEEWIDTFIVVFERKRREPTPRKKVSHWKLIFILFVYFKRR